MSFIHPKRPYKIIFYLHKRYADHYTIPSAQCLLIPTKEYDDDIVCDVRWKDTNSQLQRKDGLFFHAKSIEPVDPLGDFELYELWAQYESIGITG